MIRRALSPALVLGGLTLLFIGKLYVDHLDPARPDYNECVQARADGDLSRAWTACLRAVRKNPRSSAGKSAAANLVAWKPEYEKWSDRDATAARARTSAETRAKVAADARPHVHATSDRNTPDADCRDSRLPDYRVNYTGGSPEERELVARADGCSALASPSAHANAAGATFCCPKPARN
jgi:hypothetical protein